MTTTAPDAFDLGDQWMSARQVGELLGITQSRVNQLRREKQLPAFRAPLGWLFPRLELEAIAEARKARASGHPL